MTKAFSTKVFSVMANKGGVGKTSTVTTLAAACARKGYFTVVIDADINANSTKSMGVEPTDGLHNLIVGTSTWKNEAVQVPEPFAGVEGNLLVLPSGQGTGVLEKNTFTVDGMARIVEQIRGVADIVLIDTAPGFDDLNAGAYAASDCIILPTLLEYDSVDGISGTIEIMQAVKALTQRVPKVFGILPTRFKPKYASEIRMYEYVKLMYGRRFKIFDPIMESVAYADARFRCMSIYSHAERITRADHSLRFDKRAANRSVPNFDESIADAVIASLGVAVEVDHA